MTLMLALARIALRHTQRHRLQSLLVILGIALGVAVVIAIDVANESAQRAFELSTETITGRATHQIIGTTTQVPVDLYRQLRVELGAAPLAPVVDQYVRVPALGNQPLRLLGIDPFAEPPFRDYLGQQALPLEVVTSLIVEPRTVLLSESLAAQYGIAAGDVLRVQIGEREVALTVVALLRPGDDLSQRALEGLLLADISTAQEVLGVLGTLSRIDLIAQEEGQVGNTTLEEIEKVLPAGVQLQRPGTRSAAIEQMTRAFELNLMALSLLALVVGMFLIYNTISFSVVQRRPVIGTLRALGITRREVFMVIILEALVLGSIGAALGIALGLLLSRETIRLVTQTINDLYFVVSVRSPEVPPLVIAKGVGLGIAVSVAAALLPAYEATTVPPRNALIRSEVEERARILLPHVTVGAFGVLLAGVLLLRYPSQRVDAAFAGLFGLVIGFALLTPLLTLLLMTAIRPLSAALFQVTGKMAPRTIVRSLSRTSVAVAALMVAVSVIIGVGIMIGSFRQTVVLWLGSTLEADVYVSPPSSTASRVEGTVAPEIVAATEALPYVAKISTARDVNVLTVDGIPVQVLAVMADTAGDDRQFLWREASRSAVWEAMTKDAVLVSEPFARRHGIERGKNTTVTLHTDRGLTSFRVAGVFYDYSSDQGLILMRDPLYRHLWNDRAISSFAVWLKEGEDVDRAVTALRALVAESNDALLIQSNRGLRESALQVFDRAFAITSALQFLATIVAFIGVLSALMALQIERAREIGILRAAGMTVRQLWSLTLVETGLMGAAAGLIALPTGFVLALVLIYVINVRSFGWTLQLMIDPAVFVQAFGIALGAAVLGGLYPAFRLGRLSPAEVLRGE